MKRIKISTILFSAAFLCLTGCTALAVGGAAVGAGAGTYVYVQGELKTDYHHPFEKVWSACERVVADMRAIEVVPVKEIGKGRIDAIIEDEKVRISVEYKARNLTNVSVRVGTVGNRTASQRIHDKIAEQLS